MKLDRKLLAFVAVFSLTVASALVFAASAAKACDGCGCGLCDGGCGSSACNQPSASVSLSTPSDTKEGEEVQVSVHIENNGQLGRYYDISAYVCRSDDGTDHGCGSCSGCGGSDCAQMSCDDNRVYVDGNGYKQVKCSLNVGCAGYYRIKLVLSEDGISNSQTLYSSEFKVLNERGTACPGNYCEWSGGSGYAWNYPCFGAGCGRTVDEKTTADYRVGEYRCFGSYRQQLIADGCEKRWRIADYCPYGCEGNKCVEPMQAPKSGSPEIFMKSKYDVERCGETEAWFSVKNSGESGSFDIKVEGSAADWVEVVPSVAVAKGETKQVTAFVSVPCGASAGEHTFTITAVGGTTDSRTAAINVRAEGLFNTQLSDLFGLVIVVVVLAGVVLKRDAILAYARRSGVRKSAEERFDKPL